MRYRVVALSMLLVVGLSGAAVGRGVHSGISGLIVEGPTCPVERVPPVPGCAARPLVATLRIWRSGERTHEQSVRSRSDGRFRVKLPPGTYTVEGASLGASPFPRPPPPTQVHVRPGGFTSITLTYDTGIR